MGEANANADVAHHLREHGAHDRERRHEALEILEAVLLALVAVLTAWSGFQAAKWDGDSAREYATAARLRVEADQYFGRSGQTLDYNAATFNTWLEATARGEKAVAALMAQRFTPEYREAFEDWLALDPLDNPDAAPAGPRYMPSYEDPLEDKSEELSKQSSEAFEAGVHSRETGRVRPRHGRPGDGPLPRRSRPTLRRARRAARPDRRVGSPARLRSRHHGDASAHLTFAQRAPS